MKRTTVFLDEALLRRLQRRAQADGKSFAQCVREAVAAYLAPAPAGGKRALPGWVGMFRSGRTDTSERVDEIIAESMRRKGPHG